MKTTLFVILLLSGAALAGCVDAPPAASTRDDAPGEDGQPGATPVEPIQGDPLPSPIAHDHAEPAQHEVALNIDLAGYPMTDATVRSYAEMDVQRDRLVQCSSDGVLLWNVSDPATPVLIATLESGASCPDVKMTDDAEYVIVAGTQLWDIRDPMEPVKVAESDEMGCHMCAIHTINGKEYLFSAANGKGMSIAEITREPPAITKVGEWGFGQSCLQDPTPWLPNPTSLRAPDPDCLIIGQFHDMYVYDDPILNKTLAVPAYWDLGMWFVDVSDPAKPKELGHWADYQGESGDLHTTSVDFLQVGGETRRIAVAASETGPIIGAFSTAEPSSVYVFDATDLDDIHLLARWVNPGKRPSGAQGGEPPIVGEFSTHNLQFEHGKIYLAHYHAGVWVLDVQAWLDAGGGAAAGTTSHVVGDEVPVLGVFNTHGMDGEKGRSMVWDVVLNHGYIYASDEMFGLFVLHFAGDPAGDAAWTSDA